MSKQPILNVYGNPNTYHSDNGLGISMVYLTDMGGCGYVIVNCYGLKQAFRNYRLTECQWFIPGTIDPTWD